MSPWYDRTFFCVIGIVTCAFYVFLLFRSVIHGFRGLIVPSLLRQSNKDLAVKYGNWAVVTGATDGIGLAYAKELAARKVNVVLISRSEEKLKKVASEIEDEFSVQTKIIQVDFSEGRPVYETIKNELKDITVGILVNNVGASIPHPLLFTELSEDMIWDMVNVNVAAVTLMTEIVLPQMQKNRKGAIVNVSSGFEAQPTEMVSVYGATKAFVMHFTKSLQCENHNSGVTIQILSPGMVYTNMMNSAKHFFSESLISPSARIYAKHAIGTLGILNHTAGYLPHSIWTTFTLLIPQFLLTYALKSIAESAKTKVP